jgi:two-component system, cell cycle sensor histidine kinase PleC
MPQSRQSSVRWEKVRTTLGWSAACIVAAMLADYTITVQMLANHQAYTPLITFCVATIVAIPTAYVLVSGRINLRGVRDDLALARDAAVNAQTAKDQFFSNMSHELRTPLNAILGFSDLLQLEAFSTKRAEYASFIHGAGLHLLSLVDDLLDLSRIESGRTDLKLESLRLEDLVLECVLTAEPGARLAGIVLVRQIRPNLPSVLADRRALKQILFNLLSNAIKFSPTGSSVDISATRSEKGEVVLSVTDRGVGIAEKDIPRVFERFGQVRHEIAGMGKGTGLGLPIVKGLVEAHGGRVELHSQLGHGTCVTVIFPIERVEPREVAAFAS